MTQLRKGKHAAIIEIMENKQVISIKELSELLDCTEMTVRRNLDELEEKGFVKRERGFARLLKPAEPTEYFKESGVNAAEKRAIAAAALRYVEPYKIICLDSGTSVQCLVELLPDDVPLSVITPSLMAALTLSNKKQIQVFLPGGFLHHNNRSLLLNEQSRLESYKADVAFLSCRSLRIPEGTFEHTSSMLSTKRSLASIAEKKILLLDHSKWGLNSLCPAIDLADLDIIITDSGAPADLLEEAAGIGKEIIVVEPFTAEVVKHYNPST